MILGWMEQPPDSLQMWLLVAEIGLYTLLFYRLFSALETALLGSHFKKRWKLNAGSAADLVNKAVSAAFGIWATMAGLAILHWSSARGHDQRMSFINDLVTRAMVMSVAYFIYDQLAMYKVFAIQSYGNVRYDISMLKAFLRGRPLIIAHHFLLAFVLIPMIMLRRDHKPGDVMIGFTFLLEMSTPFVALRGILSSLKLKESSLYKINGLLMVAVFFVCRILIYPLFYWTLASIDGLTFWQTLRATPPRCAIWMLLTLGPQVYWFQLMLQGAFKMLQPLPTRPSGSS